MPLTNPIRYDLQAGTLGAAITDAAQSTIDLGQTTPWPTLQTSRGDYIPLTLIDGTNISNSEIVYMSVYTAGNSTGSIARGQETASGAGAATTWASGVSWENGPTAVDLQGPQAVAFAGNTSGTMATLSAGTVTFAGGRNITMSQNANAVTVSAPHLANVWSVSGNSITGNAGSINVSGGDASNAMNIQGAGEISVGMLQVYGNGVVQVSAPQHGLYYYPQDPGSTVMSATLYSGSVGAGGNSSLTTASYFVVPMMMPGNLTYNEVRMPIINSATTTVSNQAWSSTAGHTVIVGTLNGGAISSLSSYTNQIAFSYQNAANSTNASASFKMTYGGTATTNTTTMSVSTNNAAAAGFWTGITGSKMIPLMTGQTQSLVASQYYLLVGGSYSTAGSNLGAVVSFGQQSQVNLTHLQDIGKTQTASTTGIYPYLGIASGVMSSNSLVPSINVANISSVSNNASFMNRSIFVHFNLNT